MADPKPLRRVEETDGGRLRVVEKDVMNLCGQYPDGRRNILTQEYGDLFTNLVPKKGGPERVRIGTATHTEETDGWFIHGANGIFAEAQLDERELTDAEDAWMDDRPWADHETVVEFEIPHPEDLRSAILDQDLDRFDCLDAVIPDHGRRHDVLTELQERIAEEDVRANRLDPREGFAIDLAAEWDPENGHNDDRDAKHLYDMASMRADAHLCDWGPVAGFEYSSFRNARHRVLDIHEPKLDPYDLCALDVAGYPEWSYCRECGAVAPDEQFLQVELERRSGERRVCDRCADRRAEWDHAVCYTAENVGAAKDERAQRLGGQRTLMGEYDGE